MGLGRWIEDKVDDAGEYLQGAYEDGKEDLGGLVNSGDHGLGGLLEEVGLEGASDFVDARGDDFADSMGAGVAEMELGETQDAKQVVHGEVARIEEVVTHLEKFASSMNSAATGLSGIDTGGWTGAAAERYESIASAQPGKWRTAGSAMSDAASAWSAYASTGTWAQGKAREAIVEYEKAKLASEAAVDAYNTKVKLYNAGVDAKKSVEELPDRPGPFLDPGQADMEAAQQSVTSARSQRDEAAERAQSSIRAATSGAPQEPEFTDRMGANIGDVYQMQQVMSAHATAGAFKATGEVVKFARGLNPTDPYNMRNPAAYVEGLSNTATGLIHTANHPTEVVSAIIGAGWTTDPAEAFGKLIPTIVGTAATGGAGGAAAVTSRIGTRTAVNAAESAAQRSALRVADDVPSTHTGSMDDLVKATTKDPVDLATGTVLLAQIDVELPGLLPLVLQRKHLSSWRYGVWFGGTCLDPSTSGSTSVRKLSCSSAAMGCCSPTTPLLSKRRHFPVQVLAGRWSAPRPGATPSPTRGRDSSGTTSAPVPAWCSWSSPPTSGWLHSGPRTATRVARVTRRTGGTAPASRRRPRTTFPGPSSCGSPTTPTATSRRCPTRPVTPPSGRCGSPTTGTVA